MATITHTYEITAKQFPDKIAIQTYKEKLTYREWNERVCKTADWFHSLPNTNKTIGIFMPNGIPFLQLFTGAAMAGWVAVPFDLKWKETELQRRLALSLPSVLITTKNMYDDLKQIYPNVRIWEDSLVEINKACYTGKRKIEGDLPFYMGFTSGSTGEPKAFIRSHESWIASFDCNRFDFHMDEADHVLIPGALIHSHFLYGAISTLFMGGTVYLLGKFSPSQVLSLIQAQPITVVYVVPTMIEAILVEDRNIEKHIKIISSGAKWEENSKLMFRDIFPNLSMYEFYGASELSFVTFLSDQENNQKPESVGKPCHNVEIQVRNSNREKVKPYEIGKVYVRSKMIFIGYLDAENNIQTIQDENGWITVHDMGYLDEDGFLYISGRESNMILYGGINIFAEEIEAVLSLHPNVEAVAVVGQYDPYWGQIPAAAVKGTAAKMELRRLCKTKLASYKVPRKWYFIDEMPLTTSGKIARAQIKELIERKVNPD